MNTMNRAWPNPLPSFILAGACALGSAAQAQIANGTYDGELKCGALLTNPNQGPWTQPVRLTANGDLMWWVRSDGRFTESGTGTLLAGRLELSADGAWKPGDKNTGKWRMVTALNLDGGKLSGPATLFATDGQRVRECSVSIAVTPASGTAAAPAVAPPSAVPVTTARPTAPATPEMPAATPRTALTDDFPAVPAMASQAASVAMSARSVEVVPATTASPFGTALAYADGAAAAPDSALVTTGGPYWWHRTTASPSPVPLRQRTPTAAEQALINRARALLVNRPAKAIALVDGDTVLYTGFKMPAGADSMLFGYSMGKTVTAMAVGQAICDGKLRLDTKANELMPELNGKALGNATVRDLLRMASGAAEPNADSTIWTAEQFGQVQRGDLDMLSLMTEDRVTKAEKGVFSEYKPGEHFAYKATDPYVLGVMVSRATRMPWNQWLQERVLNPMGAAAPGLYEQDRRQTGLADSGLRVQLDDWIRFGVWVKRSSKAPGCFGDFVRAATTTQIANSGSFATRKVGKLFAGYGYFTWTENQMAPDTAFASGWGGQRISFHKDSDRMVVVFSNVENWMPEVYELTKDWNRLGR